MSAPFFFLRFLTTCTKYGQKNANKIDFLEKKSLIKQHCRAKLGEKKSKISENQFICLNLIYSIIFYYILIHFYITSIKNHIKLRKFNKK